MREITDNCAAKMESNHSGQRFQYLVDAVLDYAIFMLDPSGNVSTWNAGAERLKGYSRDEIIGKHFSVFHTEEDRAAGKPELILDIVHREGRFEDEGWRVRRDGSRFWANVVISSLRDESGTLLGFAKVTRDLSDRRRAEEELRRSEERFRLLIESTLDYAIYMLDTNGLVSTWNSGAERMKGYTANEILGKHFEVFFPDEARSAGKPAEELAVARAQGRFEDEGWRVRKDGSRFWANAVLTVLRDSDGELVGFVKITRDLTLRREAEAVERRLIREQTARELAEQARQQSKCLADATQALGASMDSDIMLSNLARSLVPRLADACAIYVLEGDHARNVAVATVDPARAETARDIFRPRYFGSICRGGLWNVLRTGKGDTCDAIGLEMLLASSDDAEPDSVSRAVAADMQAGLIAPIRIRDTVVGAIVLACGGSERRFSASDVGFVEEIGRRAGVSLENARLYSNAQAAAEAAESASRAKDEFLATVSHELRTPLTAIVGWSSLLKQRITDPSLYKPIDVILRNANAQVKIIDDMLDVSRVITGKFRIEEKAVNLVEVVRDSIEIVRPSAAAKRIQIECEHEREFHLLVADPERIRQVVWNLLSNAVKFTDPGGRIWLRVAQDGSRMVLSVTDTGHGIDLAFLPFVFERFRQADASTTRRFGGLGLGLALVRHIVELHGGTVNAHSEGPGKGACFTVTLPVRATIPAPADESSQSISGEIATSLRRVTLDGVRVLVVDDEADALDLVGAVLKDAGALVQMARSASRGLQLLMLFRPHVLISDIGMPDEDGYAFIRRVRNLPGAEGGHTPSLALSALARGEDRAKAIAAGYTAHISKPVSPEVLTAQVASLAAQHQL